VKNVTQIGATVEISSNRTINFRQDACTGVAFVDKKNLVSFTAMILGQPTKPIQSSFENIHLPSLQLI